MAEYIKKNVHGEFEKCICGNDQITYGFYPCDDLGNEVVPDFDWNGKLYVCAQCGRIVDQYTGKVEGHAQENALRL